MTHRKKIWIAQNESKATKYEKNWRVYREKEYTFKEIDFSFSNTIFDDYLMFRVVINDITKSEKMKKYLINFKTKEYSNRDHSKLEKVVKRHDLKIEIWHYIVICQIFQLHDDERKRKKLRRIIFEVSTIKINESLSDVCVNQSEFESRVKIDRDSKSQKHVKITEKSRRFATSIEKIHREKCRQFENEFTTQTKRLKRDEFFEKMKTQ